MSGYFPSAQAAEMYARMQARVAQRQRDREDELRQLQAEAAAAAAAAVPAEQPPPTTESEPAGGGDADAALDSPRSWPPSAARNVAAAAAPAEPAAAAAPSSAAALDDSGDVSMQAQRSERPLPLPSSSPIAHPRDRQQSDSEAAAATEHEERTDQEEDEPEPYLRASAASEYAAQPRLTVATAARRPLVPVDAGAARVSVDVSAHSHAHPFSRATGSAASSPVGIQAALAAHNALQRGAAASTHTIGPPMRRRASSGSSIDGVSSGQSSADPSMASLHRSFRRQQQEDAREFAMDGQESRQPGRPWLAVFKPQVQAQIGVAYFSADDATLFGGEFNSMEAVQRLKQRLEPDTIVTNATVDDALYRALQENELNPARPFAVRHLKKSDLTFESSVQSLRSLHVDDFADAIGADPTVAYELDKRSQTMLFKSFIDFRKTNMVCAMGGLVRSMMTSGAFSGSDFSALHVRSVSSIPVDVLEVDASTLDSLSIFVADMHPGRGGGGGGRPKEASGGEGGGTVSGLTSSGTFKEGFSVYSLLNQTKTSHGARLLRQWVRYPSTNMAVIEERQDHVDYFLNPVNSDLVGSIRMHLRHIKDLSRLIVRFRTKPAKRADWKAMRNGLDNVLAVSSLLLPHSRSSSSPSLVRDLCSLNLQPLSELRTEIDDVVDLMTDEEARANAKETGQAEPTTVGVKPGISPQLDALRETHAALLDILDERADADRAELASLALRNPSASPSQAPGSPAAPSTPPGSFFMPDDLLSHYQLVYLPQLGFLAKLPLRPGVTDAATTIPNFEFKFRTEADVFYKNHTTYDMDEEHGDIENLVVDAQNAILREVQERIVSLESLIRQSNAMIAELDCFVSLAVVAFQLALVRPRMVDDPSVLMIRNGRHLLMEKKIDGFVYNSTQMAGKGANAAAAAAASVISSPIHGGASSRSGGEIHLISGPNASGKTVYLKQIGIIVYLAQIGSFVPAESATIGLCDRILTRITSVDSAFSALSTFMYDATQISYMLRHATPRSLLLIDEFGKGTGSLDGISLMAATIHHMERRGVDCPKTLITTHFHELFQMGLIKESSTISFWKMSYVEQDADDDPTDSGAAADDVRGASSSSSSSLLRAFGSRHYAKRQHRQGVEGGHSKKRLPKVTCLYKLVRGLSEWSFGPSCAVAAGVSEPLMMRAVDVSAAIVNGRPIAAATDSASPHQHSSSGSSAVTPLIVNPAEQSLWHDYAAFILHATSERRPPVDLDTIREGMPFTEPDELARCLADADKDKLQQLTEQFMQQNTQRIINTMRAPEEDNGIGLESVD